MLPFFIALNVIEEYLGFPSRRVIIDFESSHAHRPSL